MYRPVKLQQEASESLFQGASPAIHPQLCGSWPGDEWPDGPDEEAGGPASLCAGSPGVYAYEMWLYPGSEIPSAPLRMRDDAR
ncbi:MAG TPA: hypothetical protein VGF67_17090 [Ktedonobacteraceae bacterium]|jgi:hypothetical protein